MEEMKVKDVINLIMEGKLEKSQLFYYVEDVGFTQVEEIYFFDYGITVYNAHINYRDDFVFTDTIFVKN